MHAAKASLAFMHRIDRYTDGRSSGIYIFIAKSRSFEAIGIAFKQPAQNCMPIKSSSPSISAQFAYTDAFVCHHHLVMIERVFLLIIGNCDWYSIR
jgi:hypothetical protein